MKNTFENAMKYIQHLDEIYDKWHLDKNGNIDKKALATALLSYASQCEKKKRIKTASSLP